MKKSVRCVPTCVFCGRSGAGVRFNIFTPRFKPFGTACVDCEDSLPPDTLPPTAGEKLLAIQRLAAAALNKGGAL